MRKIPILLFGTALAASPLAMAGPVALTDQQLERVSAGSVDYENGSTATGGIVVANSSTADLTTGGDVTLAGSAQMGASAVNLVNSAESGVANGVNVWDGRIVQGEAAGVEYTMANVDQSNLVVQSTSTRSASIGVYERAPSEYVTSTTDTWNMVTDTMDLDSSVNVDTSHSVLGQEVNAGLGLGLSGRVNIDVEPANLNVLLEANSSIHTVVGVNGEINLPRPFGSIEAEGTLTNTMTADGRFEIDVATPAISVDAVGSVCYTKLGVCSANTIDNSTYVTENTVVEENVQDTRGALRVSPVEAEYIVLDNSSLEVNSTYSVNLADSAQMNARAVNVVNAAGGVVANGVNVARTTVGPNLNQVNTVVQRR